MPVVAPVFVPLIRTVTPDKAAPASLVTLPVTVFCCANASAGKSSIPINAESTLFFMWTCTGVCRTGTIGQRVVGWGDRGRCVHTIPRPKTGRYRIVANGRICHPVVQYPE